MTQRNKNIAVIILAIIGIVIILIDWLLISREYRSGFQWYIAITDVLLMLYICMFVPTLPDDNYGE